MTYYIPPIDYGLLPKKQELPIFKAYELAGRALAQFGLVESGLSWMYASLMEPCPPRLSLITLEQAQHLDTKLRIIEGVSKSKLADFPETLKKIEQLLKQIRNRKKVRNKLAHRVPTYWHKDYVFAMRPEAVALPDGFEVRFAPPELLGSTAGTSAPVPLKETTSIAVVEAFISRCNDHHRDLISLSATISKLET